MSDKPKHVHLEIKPMRLENSMCMTEDGKELTEEEIEKYRQLVIKAINGGQDAGDTDRQ